MLAPNGKEYNSVTIYPTTDVFNREVKLGDILAYSVRGGSYHAIHIGKVCKLEPWEQEYTSWWDQMTSYVSGVRITIVIRSTSFQYSTSKYNLDSKYRKFLNEEIEKGNVPSNWETCYVNYPKKTSVGLGRAIIIDPELLSDIDKKVILEEKWVIDKIKTL